MKPGADVTSKSWVIAAPCPWCLAFAGALPCASRQRLCVRGSSSPLSLGAGCCRPGREHGCPNICGQMPCRISLRKGARQWHSSGQSGWVTVTLRAGGIAGVPQGLLGAGLPSFLCPAGFLLAAKKRRLKREFLEAFLIYVKRGAGIKLVVFAAYPRVRQMLLESLSALGSLAERG